MDGMQLRFLYVFTDLILPLVVGYYMHQHKLIDGRICNKLISFNIVVICTILSVLSFWVLPLTAQLVLLPLFGIILAIIPGIVSYVFVAHRYKNYLERGSYLASAMLSNLGTLGGLCAFILYGEIGFAYVQIVGLVQNVVLLLFCFPMAQYYYQQQTNIANGKRMKLDFRQLFINWNQLPLIGMLLGMTFYVLAVPRPPVLGMAFEAMVHLGAWLALLPVGYLIDFTAAQKYYWRILDLLPIKFIITPILVYLIITQLFDDQIILGTMIILAATPTAINAVVTARLFKLDVDLSIAAFILTTVIYLLVVFPVLFFYITAGNTL